ncbi:MAG TPA: HAMP domain-containing sensor histidine kinase [Actinomycetota bacterium]|nr:HAMP domain-containing sensor histidine kinase [Actinomycetota bacterium]
MRDHGRGPGPRGFRPPWWPENEPFPPRGRGPWSGAPRHLLRRVGLIVFALFGITFLASALAVAAISGVLGLREHRGLVPAAAILGLLLLFAIAAVGRTARRMAGPMAEVMEAADRVAGGDYGVRVDERGTPEMRRLARSFNAMTERLRTSEDHRKDLLADVAHELRTPLSVIRGNAEGMLDALYPADRAHLEPLIDEIKVMSRLLDDLQTLSTAEAGALRLHRSRVEPGQLVEDVITAFRSQADDARVRVEARVGEGLPEVDVDPVRIGEVLANLLSNALRHTPPEGSVVIAAEPAPHGVAFTVTDTGTGIVADALPHVFDRFVKAKDSGGAGLGLAIAKALVESHGGRIAAESDPGRGTTVRVVLPRG